MGCEKHEKAQEETLVSDLFGNDDGPVGLKRRSVQGSTAVLASQGGHFVISTLTTMVLARLLDKSDYGLIAMAAIILNFVVLFRNIGLDTATVRAERVTDEQVSALFWINAGIGLVLTVVVAGCAPLTAAFFEQPELTSVVAALAPTFLFSCLMLQHRALLRRRMLFSRLAVVTLSAHVIAALAAIGAALVFRSYWALVVLRLAQSLALVVGIWAVCPWRPSRPAPAAGLRSMLSFGGHLTASRVTQFVMRNADNLLIGKVLGQDALGFYERAYAQLLVPVRQLNQPFTSVVTPGLAKVVNDPPRFAAYYTRALNVLTALSMPVVVLCTLAAHEVIGIVLGPGWEESVTVFLFLAPAAFLGAFNVATGWVFVAVGRADRALRMSVVSGIVTVTAMVIGLRWGIVGVACAVSAVNLAGRLPQLLYCYHGTPVSMRDFGRAVGRPAVASLGAGLVAAVLLRYALPPWPNLLAAAAVKTALFGVLYPGLYCALPGGLAELRRNVEALRELKPGREKPETRNPKSETRDPPATP